MVELSLMKIRKITLQHSDTLNLIYKKRKHSEILVNIIYILKKDMKTSPIRMLYGILSYNGSSTLIACFKWLLYVVGESEKKTHPEALWRGTRGTIRTPPCSKPNNQSLLPFIGNDFVLWMKEFQDWHETIYSWLCLLFQDQIIWCKSHTIPIWCTRCAFPQIMSLQWWSGRKWANPDEFFSWPLRSPTLHDVIIWPNVGTIDNFSLTIDNSLKRRDQSNKADTQSI
jgi:hypothetical protein